MVVKHLNKAFALFVIFYSSHIFALTSVTASVDKNPVMVKESLVLTVVADDDVSSNALDTSPLLNDFIVGRSSVSTQTSMINFKTSRSTSWTTVLIPRKEGELTIPALSVDGYKTTPISLKVLAANDKNATKQQDIFVTAEISNDDIYVQQILTMSVKLHFATQLKRGNLSEPELADANITQIGKDQEKDEIIEGKRYRVIERTYAITPQKSGDFVITSPRFSGEVMMESNRRSNFLSFAETKPVSVIGDDIPLTVRPIPVNYQGQWLPSELLILNEEWQPDVNNFKVGEPITRTITLTAAGLTKEQLPKLSIDVPKGLKVYPDQAELNSTINQGRLVSQQLQNFALVASRPGEYELPALSIPWFNTVTNKIEQAEIPSQRITVQPNEDFPQEVTPVNNHNNEPTTSIESTDASIDSKERIVIEHSWLQWLFLALWLMTSAAWAFSSYLRRSTNQQLAVSNKASQASALHLNKATYSAIVLACENNQGEVVLSCLTAWVNSLKGITAPAANIDEAISLVNNATFSDEINLLQQSLYGKSSGSGNENWQGKSLLTLIKTLNKNSVSVKQAQSLTLNP